VCANISPNRGERAIYCLSPNTSERSHDKEFRQIGIQGAGSKKMTSTPLVATPRNFADALAALLEAAAEAGARRALAEIHPSQPTWIPLRQSPLGYRQSLNLVRNGELQVHGIGNKKFLNREQLDSWLFAHPMARTPPMEIDEIQAIIDFNENRRRKRKKREQGPR